MTTRIQIRNDTAANWTSSNPTLAEGEIGFERDTYKIKVGDGATVWNSLAYFTSGGLPNPFALTAILTPPELDSDVNDYNPTGLDTADVLRLDTDNNHYDVTGLAGGADGRIIILHNVATGHFIHLLHENAASAAANRFSFQGSDVAIFPSKMVILMYDSTLSRWRLLASGSANALQGVPIAAGLKGGISNNGLLIYNQGDDVLEPTTPDIVVDLALSTIGTSLAELVDLTDGGESTLHTHPGGGGGEAFPVGSVFISVVSTNPATLLGYGTWASFGAGRVLVGLDAGQSEFDTVEETGGAKTHTLTSSEMPSHTHTQDAHNHTQDAHTHGQDAHGHTQAAHDHPIWSGGKYTGYTVGGTGLAPNGAGGASAIATGTATPGINANAGANHNSTATNQNATATNQNTGGGAAHNNMPPYIVCYFWKRTA